MPPLFLKIIIFKFAKMKVKGYSNYEVYPETGQIYSYLTNKFIGIKDSYGYLNNKLIDDNGVVKYWKHHRFIWTAVHGEIPKGMQINHIDENKTNNSIFNLVLMTPKENNNWGTRIERAKRKLHKVIVGKKDNKIEFIYSSIKECENDGFSRGPIDYCLHKKRKHHKGYQWYYLTDCLADILEEIQIEDMKDDLLT